MTRFTPVILPGPVIAASELRAAALDGEVVALGEGFVPIDTPITARARAASLSPLLIDSRVVVADRSAAWVWGWGPAPNAVMTCVAITARIPSPDRSRLRTREVVIDNDEHRMLDIVRVTTPERTLLDLARHDSDPHVVDLLAAGIYEHGLTSEAIDLILARRPALSYVRLARSRLLTALDQAQSNQPLLTR